MITKKELRNEYKQKRAELNDGDKNDAAFKIAQALKRILFKHSICHIFLPIKQQNEVDTIAIINYLNEKNMGITFCTSVSNFEDLTMPCYTFSVNNLVENNLGIPEPKAPLKPVKESIINTVIVPLLICNNKGYRVGYGKGFYDRFLAKLPNKSLKIGINYFDIINQEIETNANDIALDMHISPNGITTFN